MKCLNCGGPIDSSIPGRVVKCNYCGTSSACMPTIRLKQTNDAAPKTDVEKNLSLAQLDIEERRYGDAAKTLTRVIELEPLCWQAYASLAVATFWMGTVDFSHLEKVLSLIKKASQLSDDGELITGVSRAVAFNIVQVVNIKNPVGEILVKSVDALKISKLIVPEFDERDDLLETYVAKTSSKILERLSNELDRKKREFDPPKTDLMLVGKMLEMSGAAPIELLKTFIALGAFKATKKGDLQLDELLSAVKEKYTARSNNAQFPSVTFTMFGTPKIK